MRDHDGLEVSAETSDVLARVNEAAMLIFKKKSGIELSLSLSAEQYHACPMLQVYAAIPCFFSFSVSVIQAKLPVHIERLEMLALNQREFLHLEALKKLLHINFESGLDIYLKIIKQFPRDRIALFMLEACCFLSGNLAPLLPVYEAVYEYYQKDAVFLGMFAFLLAHLSRRPEARQMIELALFLEPHNPWVQHVYAHALDEEATPEEIQRGIVYFEACQKDWSSLGRFFEGHNWMHLFQLYFKRGEVSVETILSGYTQHVWGQAKDFNFEQNNALCVLWQAHLSGYSEVIPDILKKDLAEHAMPFMTDYFTPYMTVSAILSVALFDYSKALIGLRTFEAYAKNQPKGSAWRAIALPILEGCLFYLKKDYQKAYEQLKPFYQHTRGMGHSDEQRSIFVATFKEVSLLVSTP